MANQHDIATWIDIGKISQYLMANAIQKKSFFQGGVLAKENIRLLYIVRNSVEFGFTHDNGSAGLNELNNYMINLCGKYSAEAYQKLTNAQGTIVKPGIVTDNTIALAYDQQIRFYVGVTPGAPNAGSTSYVFVDKDLSFKKDPEVHWDFGREVPEIPENSTTPYTGTPYVSYEYGYSVGGIKQITLHFNGQALQQGDYVSIQLYKETNLTYQSAASGGGGNVPQYFYTGTTVNNQNIDLVDTNSTFFTVPVNNSEVLNITIFSRNAANKADKCVRQIIVLVDNIAGTITNIDVSNDTYFGSNTMTVNSQLLPSGNFLKVNVTGINGKTINHTAIFTPVPSGA